MAAMASPDTDKSDVDEDCCHCSKKFSKRILVTGGAGFIGSHLVTLLVKKYPNYLIINLDKLDYCASLRNLDEVKNRPNYRFIQGDICEADFMRYIFNRQRIDHVIHCAAQSHVDLSFWSSLDFTKTNVYGTHVLVNAAHEAGVKLFLHVSTDEVYGGNSSESSNESAKLNPSNPYAATKASAEYIVASYWECFKLPVVITRSNNVYGPNQYPEKIKPAKFSKKTATCKTTNIESLVIPKFIGLLDRNRKCCIHGNGGVTRNFLHVDDVTAAFDVLLHHGQPGAIYNIGSDFEISVIDLAKFLVEKMKGVKLTDSTTNESGDQCKEGGAKLSDYVEFVDDRLYNDLRYNMDSSRLHQLGWSPKISWEQGIQETIDWYVERSHFSYWRQAEDALSPFPYGSNTLSLGPPNNNHHTNH